MTDDTINLGDEYRGLCAGGKLNGRILSANTKRVAIPVEIKGQRDFGQNFYVWRDDLRMWIWDHQR